MRAWDLAQQGWKQRDIAVALDASEGAVSHWLAAARRGGPEALRSHPAPGAVPKLTPRAVSADPRLPLAWRRVLWLPGRCLDL